MTDSLISIFSLILLKDLNVEKIVLQMSRFSNNGQRYQTKRMI